MRTYSHLIIVAIFLAQGLLWRAFAHGGLSDILVLAVRQAIADNDIIVFVINHSERGLREVLINTSTRRLDRGPLKRTCCKRVGFPRTTQDKQLRYPSRSVPEILDRLSER